MLKFLVLLFAFTIPALQQEQVIGSSGNDADVVSSDGSTSDLPSTSPAASSSSRSADGNLKASMMVISPSAPSDFNFVNSRSLGGSSTWIFPSGSFLMYPRYYLATYTITFNTDCPEAGVVLSIAGTGSVFVYNINVPFWELSWGNPWPTIHNITIPASRLKCGCNTLRIYVYNYYFPSPAALIYSLSQDTSKCYKCTNLGVTFYNRRTCKCQCVQKCECKTPLRWADYPQCGCMCQKVLQCISTHYFDYQSCRCLCKPKCCKTGYFWNQRNCSCDRIITTSPFLTKSADSGGIINLESDVTSSP